MSPDLEPSPTLATTSLGITGMTCAACVRHVERALAAVPGVAEASVNFATERAVASYDPSRVRVTDLEAAVANAGYGTRPLETPSEAASSASTNAKVEPSAAHVPTGLLVAALATLPVLVLGMSHGAIPFADQPLGRALQFALAAVVLFGPGLRLLRQGFAAARRGAPDMNTLVAIGALVAFAWSTLATFAPTLFPHGEHAAPHVYFEAAAAIVTFVLLGKHLESRARWHLADAVRSLHRLVPATARRVVDEDGDEREVPVAELVPGDLVRVRPGERVPVDGRVEDGTAAVDESLLSGESEPVAKGPGDRATGGSLAVDGALLVRVERTGKDTVLARIAASVEEAQGSRAPIARLADRISGVFVPVVLALAALTFAVWWLLEPTADGLAIAVERMVAVLVIACPCALGLATPAAVAVGAARGAELGILFQNGAALERASHVDSVLFDKTGTLTAGRPELVAVRALGAFADDELLRLAATAELGSPHPLARAVVASARRRGLAVRTPSHFVAVPASGVEAVVDGRTVLVGKPDWLRQRGVAIDGAALRGDAGRTQLAVAVNGRAAGVLVLQDEVRPEARAAVAALRERGIRIAMLTGDRRDVAEAAAADLALHELEAELLPADKAERVRERQRAGEVVAMVGDGVNDAPALAAADLGIAVQNGIDVATAAADVRLLRGGLEAVPLALHLARATMRTIRRNLAWAFAYNLVGIPIAAGAFAGLGLEPSPVYASAAMSLSSVSVLLSSLSLRGFARAEGGA